MMMWPWAEEEEEEAVVYGLIWLLHCLDEWHTHSLSLCALYQLMAPCTTTTTTNSRQSFFFFLSFESASHRSSAYFCNQLYVTGNRKRCAVFNCFSQWSRRIVFSSLLCVCVCVSTRRKMIHTRFASCVDERLLKLTFVLFCFLLFFSIPDGLVVVFGVK